MPVNGFGRLGVMDTSVNKLLDKLKENYIDNINLIALLTEETAEIIYFKDEDIFLKFDDMGFIKSNNKEFISDWVNKYDFENLSLATSIDVGFLKEKYKLNLAVNNWAYLNDKKIDIGNHDIRKLDETSIDYLDNNYEGSRDYLLYCLEIGMYGYYVNDKLVAFIGRHDELSMGLLYVEEGYRKLNIGFSLEAFLINKLLDEKRIIYCQVSYDNIASQRLQEKLGLVKSNQINYWFGR